MKEHRLTKRPEYQHCYARGRKVYSKNFVIFIATREKADMPWRLGMAVTKKVGCAVRRNRMKRLIRESIRHAQQGIPMGYDFVVVPKQRTDVSQATIESVTAELYPYFVGQVAFNAPKGHS